MRSYTLYLYFIQLPYIYSITLCFGRLIQLPSSLYFIQALILYTLYVRSGGRLIQLRLGVDQIAPARRSQPRCSSGRGPGAEVTGAARAVAIAYHKSHYYVVFLWEQGGRSLLRGVV